MKPLTHYQDAIVERRRRVVEMTRAGMGAKMIADILKVTPRTVGRDRVAMGVAKPAPPRFTAEELARVEELLADGASITEAARTIGRASHHGVWARFKGRGWTPQQVGKYTVLCKQMAKLGLHG